MRITNPELLTVLVAGLLALLMNIMLSFDGDSSLLESVVKAMGNTYRTSRSHYYELIPR